MKRKDFLKTGICFLGSFPFLHPFQLLKPDTHSEGGISDIVLIHDGTPAGRVQKALQMLGGIKRFVHSGDTVFVKPNMSWDRTPEYGSNTEPEVVAEVIRQCYNSGAKKVIVSDRTCNEDKRCYRSSGIEKSAKDAGADVRFARPKLFEKIYIEDNYSLSSWTFHRDALEADVLINIPVLKNHSMATVTMGFKNMMGLIGKERGRIHFSFNKKIVDVNRVLKSSLTLLDATRVLMRNGPSGGNLDDVVQRNILLAGVDPVLVDAWGANVFGVEPETLPFLKLAEQCGLGSADYKQLSPVEFSLS